MTAALGSGPGPRGGCGESSRRAVTARRWWGDPAPPSPAKSPTSKRLSAASSTQAAERAHPQAVRQPVGCARCLRSMDHRDVGHDRQGF